MDALGLRRADCDNGQGVSADYSAEDVIGTWDGYYACDSPGGHNERI
ncbi:MAG: hypothetical protein IJ615_05435 [Bacteroidaceae bacterium]|nr:hypothetical protein [Bacteroidaceae bacterium]